MRRVLIDECINPRLASRLRSELPGFTVVTVRELQLAGVKDRSLVAKIQDAFEVFLTIDKGFEFEHDLRKLNFGIIIVSANNNQMPSYERLLANLIMQICGAEHGQVVHVVDPALH